MKMIRFKRWLPLAALSLAWPFGATAQGLPPTAPTKVVPSPIQAAAQTTSAPTTFAQSAPTRARVQLRNGLVTVSAENSSLNQILREVADRTNMTITGGVADERVFGIYGPADAATILNQLLEGTGSNILILDGGNHRPRELVLTGRNGGPTPPAPPAIAAADEDGRNRDESDTPPQQVHNTDRNTSPAAVTQPTPIQPAVPPTTAAPSADTTTQQSPNGVKTPQQIYEQLMKLQQQPPTPPK